MVTLILLYLFLGHKDEKNLRFTRKDRKHCETKIKYLRFDR